MSAAPSGPDWCARFPTATSLAALKPEFGAACVAFIEALKNAEASVTISATYRPPQRAYLMHWCCKLATDQISSHEIPPMSGVDIDWAHGGNHEAAHTAAILMKSEYNIAFPAALESRHTQRRAVDMSIHWTGVIQVKDKRGMTHPCQTQEDLWPIGASYGVIKLASDAPHWSDDGH